MIKHLVEIKNYNDACGKCKHQIKSKHGYRCGIFNEPLPTELSNKYNCRCDDCLSLGYAYDDEEVISKKLQKFIATQTAELIAKAIVWHKYPDEKPEQSHEYEVNVPVIIAVTTCYTLESDFADYNIDSDTFWRYGTKYKGITHWAYLPALPKDES